MSDELIDYFNKNCPRAERIRPLSWKVFCPDYYHIRSQEEIDIPLGFGFLSYINISFVRFDLNYALIKKENLMLLGVNLNSFHSEGLDREVRILLKNTTPILPQTDFQKIFVQKNNCKLNMGDFLGVITLVYA